MIIFYKIRLYSFLLILFGAMPLISCDYNDDPTLTLADDKIITDFELIIKNLKTDLGHMKKRMEISEESMKENALKPRSLDFNRKEYFKYEKMHRQIDQELAYYQIKLSMRKNYLDSKLKNMTRDELLREHKDFETSKQANKKKYPWSELDSPE